MPNEDQNSHIFIDYFSLAMTSLQKLGGHPLPEAVQRELDFLSSGPLGEATISVFADFTLSCPWLLGGPCDSDIIDDIWHDFPLGPADTLSGLYAIFLGLRGKGSAKCMQRTEELLRIMSVSRFAHLCGEKKWSFPPDIPLSEAFLQDFTPGDGGIPDPTEIAILKCLAVSCVADDENYAIFNVNRAYEQLEQYWATR